MKKTFPLHIPGKEDLRVVEAIKVTVSKYVRRERKKKLPEGVDFWDFTCKVGTEGDTAPSVHLAAVPKAIEAVAQDDVPEVYVEILACPGHRAKKPAAPAIPREES